MLRSAAPRPVRRSALSIVIALAGVLVLAAPASAAPPNLEQWHRLNPETPESAPEHEQLHCLPGLQWVCRYDKLPEPGLGFNWDRTIGMFHGRIVGLDPADCPGWLTEVCEATDRAVVGSITYAVDEGGAFRTGHALLFTDDPDLAPLYVWWFNVGFACPWYDSFDDALAANPTGTEADCLSGS